MSGDNPRKYGAPPFSTAVIHGGPGAAGEMAPVARELSASYGILEPLQTADSLNGQVNELRDLLEKNAAMPVNLIGFSWGAWLGFIFSARYPGIVKKLILVGSGPFEEKYARKIQETRFSRLSMEDREELKSLTDMLDGPESDSRNLALERFGRIFGKADAFNSIQHEPESIDFRADIHEKVWKEASMLRQKGTLLEKGKEIKCPVVAIHGDHDPHPAGGVEKPLHDILGSFRFFLLDRCGHRPWIERYGKDRFYDIIREELIEGVA